jgi:hypothetical protein
VARALRHAVGSQVSSNVRRHNLSFHAMNFTELTGLLGRQETLGIPIGFTVLTVIVQAFFRALNMRTLGADLSAAAVSLICTIVVSKIDVVNKSGSAGLLVFCSVFVAIAWCICLHWGTKKVPSIRSQPGRRAAAKFGVPFLTFLLGVFALYVAAWCTVALTSAASKN